jgi:hypothetical protein
MQGRSDNLGWTLAFEIAPAAIFGSATAFAASKVLALPQSDPTPLAIGFGSFCASWLLLRLFRGKPDEYVMPMFDLGAFDRELVAAAEAAAEVPPLPETSRPEQEAEPEAPADELILDDILVAIDPAARVVSLFQGNDTAGELHARIERHLRDAPRPSGPPDATQELHEAIAALRRSLR